MKVELLNNPAPRFILAKNMKVGQLGIIRERPCSGVVALRIYKGILSLENATCVWSEDCSLEVEILPPGTKVQIESEV